MARPAPPVDPQSRPHAPLCQPAPPPHLWPVCLASAGLVVALLFPPTALASSLGPPTATSRPARQVLREAEQLRQLTLRPWERWSLLRGVKRGFRRDRWEENLPEAAEPPSRGGPSVLPDPTMGSALQLELEAFGLIPPGFSIKAHLAALQAEQLGAWYDPATKAPVRASASSPTCPSAPDLETASDLAPASLEATTRAPHERGTQSPLEPSRSDQSTVGVAQADAPLETLLLLHELVHGLQDRRLGPLQTILSPSARLSRDEVLARRALVEGDATFVTIQYRLGPDIELERDETYGRRLFLAPESTSSCPTLLASGPRAFRDQTLFPYQLGQDFVSRLLREGGWQLVDQAYQQPPASSEQVLHPQKYLEGEQPHSIQLGQLELLNTMGYQAIVEGTQGELGLATWQASRRDMVQGLRLAEGWGGDRFRVYRADSGAPRALWVISWDQPAFQERFEASFRTLAPPSLASWTHGPGWTGLWLGGAEPPAKLWEAVAAEVRVGQPASRPPTFAAGLK